MRFLLYNGKETGKFWLIRIKKDYRIGIGEMKNGIYCTTCKEWGFIFIKG